jgi:hypothetical protein
MEITADVKSIAKLKDYTFIVPDYQREYVWEAEDQVEQFLTDIENEYDAEGKSNYFIGSIIIVKNKGRYDVIDGQQRLTTIILSLCAFRDLLQSQAEELDEKQKQYLKAIEELLADFDILTDEIQLRLELQYEESKDFLNRLIKKEKYEDTLTPSIKKMQQAYDKLKEHFEEYLREGIDQLTAFARYFLTHIELVVIESENLSSALKIFETINQRGAGLNAMDLVKNLLFSQAKESEFQKIKETWKEITANLQSCKEDQNPLRFLRYFLMARYYHGVIREDEIYKWIISPEGKEATNYESKPADFARELRQISKRYADLINATQRMDDNLYPAVSRIGFMNKYMSRQHLILLLSLPVSCSHEDIEYLASQTESFFFFSNTLGIQAKYNERLFAKWAEKLRAAQSVDDIKEIVEQTMVPYIKEKTGEFRSAFLNARHQAYNPLYRLRFVLGTIENTILKKAGLPLYDNKKISQLQLEHILPQTPKDGQLTEAFEDLEDYKNSVFKLGNVTLLESTINQAVNNFNELNGEWFAQKQKEYAKSGLLSACLLDDNYSIGKDTAVNRFREEYNYTFTEWTKESIAQRQKIMLELALESWKFNGKRIDQRELVNS